jgi:thymidine phosphorylase
MAEDLRERALVLAGKLLEMGKVAIPNEGYKLAFQILTSGKALEKFYAICHAQGGFTEPDPGKFLMDYKSQSTGTIVAIDNRKLGMAAKLAGAPQDKGAGIFLSKHLGDKITKEESLFTVYSESEGTLHYVFQYLEKHPGIIQVQKNIL